MNDNQEYPIQANSAPEAPLQPHTGTQSAINQKAAADLARAKLESLFKDESSNTYYDNSERNETQTTQNHAPRIEQEYQQIQSIQQQVQHVPVPPAKIDHQLPVEDTHHELPEKSSFNPKHEWAPFIWLKSKVPKGFHPPLRFAIFFAIIISLYNSQIIMGQVLFYISPGTGENAQYIVDPTTDNNVGPESKIIIPKINVDIPVVYGTTTYDPEAYIEPLKKGAAHYGTTALPGQNGNNVLLGHSSSAFFQTGAHKYAFVLLAKLELNDTFIIHYEGKRYIYQVFEIREVQPEEVGEATKDFGFPTTTLVTCTPLGTNLRRLLIHAKQISPAPASAEAFQQPDAPDTTTVPSNAPSMFDTFRNWLF